MGQISVEIGVQATPYRRSLKKEERRGLRFPRYFTAKLAAGRTPYDEVRWERRTASIGNDKGAIIFEQKDIEVPADWSQTATNIVASKYFHGRWDRRSGKAASRKSFIGSWTRSRTGASTDRYFSSLDDAENFRSELAHLTLNQKACFNSPVWFNVGVKEENRGYGWYYDEATESIRKMDRTLHRPQCSACFINSVQDTLESILDLAKTEGMLFKWGSGTGTNLSPLREENGLLWGGGRACGPLSFMKGFDAFAGVIKSGGKTRRAAKMVILNAEHPDIEQFIWCKAKEEKKAHTLVDAGYDSVARRRGLRLDLLPERQQLRARDRRVHARRGGRRRLVDHVAWYAAQPVQALRRARPDARRSPRRRGSAATPACSSTPPINKLAHVQEHGAHQRLQPVLRVHVPGRFGLQPGVAQPDEILGAGRPVRRRSLPARRGHGHRWRRRSSWTTPAIRPRRSPRTRTTTGRWVWAMPTWARC